MASKVDCIFPFGRYKGTLVSEIYETNPHYLKWVLENCDISGQLLDAVEYHVN